MTDTERIDKLEALSRWLGHFGYYIEDGRILVINEGCKTLDTDTKVYRSLRHAIDAAPEPAPQRWRPLPKRFKRAGAKGASS